MSDPVMRLLSSVSFSVTACAFEYQKRIFSTITSALGPSTAEQTLGKDLDLYAKFAVQGFAGNVNANVFATNIQIAAMGITGLPSNVTNLLPVVWAAKDEASLLSAIAQIKNAAGL